MGPHGIVMEIMNQFTCPLTLPLSRKGRGSLRVPSLHKTISPPLTGGDKGEGDLVTIL